MPPLKKQVCLFYSLIKKVEEGKKGGGGGRPYDFHFKVEKKVKFFIFGGGRDFLQG